MEFWTVLDWSNPNLFGTRNDFKTNYSLPILSGQDPKAGEAQRLVSKRVAAELLKLFRPILLQRKKCDYEDVLKLPSKIELIAWISLAPVQRSIYEDFLRSSLFKSAVNRIQFPVEIITRLKTISRHPFLLEASDAMSKRKEAKEKAKHQGGGGDVDALIGRFGGLALNQDGLKASKREIKVSLTEEVDDEEEILSNLPQNATVFDVVGRKPSSKELLAGSIKLQVLLDFVQRLLKQGHRILIFSQARLMLDIIDEVLSQHAITSCRIDGSVTGKERQSIIDSFNEGGGCVPAVCLLTTRACGVGINLIGASRVIIFDPSWNPAQDRQAVDRAYRIGQKKDVVVYRLIMAASVEEKIYEKQVFKDGLRVVTEQGEAARYFSFQESSELFTLGAADSCDILARLWKRAGEKLEIVEDIGESTSKGVLGFSRHDALYDETMPAAPLKEGGKNDSKSSKTSISSVEMVDCVKMKKPLANTKGQASLAQWLAGGDIKIKRRMKNATEEAATIDLLTPPQEERKPTSVDPSTSSIEQYSAQESSGHISGGRLSMSDDDDVEDIESDDDGIPLSPITTRLSSSTVATSVTNSATFSRVVYVQDSESSLLLTPSSPSKDHTTAKKAENISQPAVRVITLDIGAYLVDSPPPTPPSQCKLSVISLDKTSSSTENTYDCSRTESGDSSGCSEETFSRTDLESRVEKDSFDLSLELVSRTICLASQAGVIVSELSPSQSRDIMSRSFFSSPSPRVALRQPILQKSQSSSSSFLINTTHSTLFSMGDAPFKGPTLRPRHLLTPGLLSEYNRLILHALMHEESQPALCAEILMDCLKICDDSLLLHSKLHMLSKTQ